jgi:hypothetical protein
MVMFCNKTVSISGKPQIFVWVKPTEIPIVLGKILFNYGFWLHTLTL